MKKHTILLSALLFVSSISALADVCTTSSRGRYFRNESPDRVGSFNAVMMQCRGLGPDFNFECVLNANCVTGGLYPDYNFSAQCSTSSHGVYTKEMDRDQVAAFSRAVQACRADFHTNKPECGANAQCMAQGFQPSGLPVFECTTFSRGINFKNQNYDFNTTRLVVINECQSNFQTDRRECESFARCAQIGFPSNPQVTCQTHSRGRSFFRQGYDRPAVHREVVQSCQSDPFTDRHECLRNAFCN